MSASALPVPDFELLFSMLPTPFAVLSPDGALLSVNAAMTRLLPAGAAAALPGQPLEALRAAAEAAGLTLADAAAWEAARQAALAGTAQVLTPAPAPALTGADDPHRYWQATLQPMPPGAVQYLLVHLLDVSAEVRRQQASARAAEATVQEREQFRLLAETLPQLIWATNAQGEPDYTNQRFIDYTGHDVLRLDEGARQALWGQLIHPDDLPGLNEQWGRALGTGQPFEVEFRLRDKAGECRWFLTQVMALRDPGGAVRRWFGACTDVHEQRHGREQLQAQPQLMQGILDQLPLTISTMEGPDLTFTFLSARARQQMGPRAAVGRSVAESLPEVAAQGYVQLLSEVRDTGRPHFGYEECTELLDPATGEMRANYNNYGFLPLRGEQAGVLAYGLDVTEQVQARQRMAALQTAAQAADQRLRRVLESQPSITFISDQRGKVLYISPQWYDYTGSGPADAIDEVWSQALHPDDVALVQSAYAAALAAGTSWRYEFRLRGRDDQYRWFLSQGVPEPLAEAEGAGRTRQWFGTNLDIHELRETQRRLEIKDRQLSQILAQSPALIATTEGPEHRFAYANAGYDALTEHRATPGQPLAVCFPELVDQGFVYLLDGVYSSGNTYVGHETPVTLVNRATGRHQKVYLDYTYQPLRDDQGLVTGVMGFAVDVSERVQAQQRAEAAQADAHAADARLRRTAEALPIVTFITDAQGRTLYISPQWYAYTGQAPGGPWADVDARWPEVLHPDDRAESARQIQQSIDKVQTGRMEVRLRRHDGEYRWFLTEAAPELDEQGRLLRRYGYLLDVQDLRERTEELVSSRADFAALADNMAQLAWMADATGYIFWYNQQWYDYTGSRPEEMAGFGWQAVHDPEQVKAINKRYLTSIRAGEPWEDTFPLRRHDGEYRWFLSRARPIRDAATGAITRWFGTNTDVTELRRLQQQLGESEEELRIQAESIPQQVWTALPDGTLDFYNHRTAAYLGESMEKNGAAPWLSFVHPDDLAPMQSRWDAALASQRYYEAEFRLRRYDGQYRWFLGQAQARRAPGGQVLRWYGTNTDVHQQRQLQEQVLASQARFQQLLETLPQMTWTASPTGSTTYYSQRWFEYTGVTFSELKDWGWEDVVHPDDLLGTVNKWRHSLKTGEPFRDETRWRDRHGHYRWFLVRAEAIRDKAGAVVLWVGAHTDVQDFKQVQQQLENQNARLLRSNEDLDNFVYTASHDLKQPIHNMAGIFEELTRTAYFRDPDAIKLIAHFERALKQIFGTIDDLSAIVQGQRLHQEVPAEAVALAPLVDEVILSLQAQVAATGASFELDFATCPTVTFVRPNLQSVLFNLVSNSLKYAMPGRPPRIRLSSSPDAVSGRAILTVQDNGLGLDLDRYGSQLFQLFRRFHAHAEGTGMGLYLVNRIVQDHGGHIEVSSTVDEGTTFHIYL